MSAANSTERWADLVEFRDYQVSDHGRVRSRKNTGKAREWRLMQPSPNSTGYLQVTLFQDGKRYTRRVHRLVLTSFVGPSPAGMEACHIDGNPKNCRLDNLRWDTRQGNLRDQLRHGTRAWGSRHPHSVLTESQVIRMRSLRAAGMTIRLLAEEFGVGMSTVVNICRRHNWRQIGGEPPPPSDINRGKKLTASQVLAMRAARASGESVGSIAARFGIHRVMASKILNGHSWSHIGREGHAQSVDPSPSSA